MADNKENFGSSIDRLAWRSYFQAAITGMLAAGKDPRSSGTHVIIDACANVANAAIERENLVAGDNRDAFIEAESVDPFVPRR